MEEKKRKGILETLELMRFKRSDGMGKEDLYKVFVEEAEIEDKIYQISRDLEVEVKDTEDVVEILEKLSPEDQITAAELFIYYGIKYVYENHQVIDGYWSKGEFLRKVREHLEMEAEEEKEKEA